MQNIQGVEQVLMVTGMYDVIVRINVQNKDDLDRILLHVRRLDDIQSTMTLVITKSID